MEKSDDTTVRDTYRLVLGQFSYAKICLFHFFVYHKIRDEQVDLGI